MAALVMALALDLPWLGQVWNKRMCSLQSLI